MLDENEENADDLKAGNLKLAALAELKNTDFSLKKQEDESVKSHFRTYDELKEELGELTPKTDAEILTELLQKYANLSENTEGRKYKIIAILEDLDYLAHQFDNAREFVRQNGFKNIIMKNLNSTENEILQHTLKLLGSLTQNNAKVQIHALEQGCIETILRILQDNSDNSVKNKAVFAISCILRKFPLAQYEFIQRGGLEIISRQFDLQDTKLQLKLATFITDLLQEHEEATKDTKNPDFLTKVEQYTRINLRGRLGSINWCQNLNNLLFSVLIVDRYDHDAIEKTLTSIFYVADSCGSSLKDVVSGLENQYVSLSKEENEKDGYFAKMRKLCWDIITKIGNARTEL